jgi:hypothetical protein
MPDNNRHWQPNSNTRLMSMPPSSGWVREDLVNAAVLQLRQGMSEDYSALDQGDGQSELDRGDDAFFNDDDFHELEEDHGGEYDSRYFRASSTVSTNSGSRYNSRSASRQSYTSASRPDDTLHIQSGSAFTPIGQHISSGRGLAITTPAASMTAAAAGTTRNPQNSSSADRNSCSSEQDPSSLTEDSITPTANGLFSDTHDVSENNVEEFDGVHPNDVMNCLKGIKTDVLTRHGVAKPFYKSYSNWEKMNQEQKNKTLAYFRKLPQQLQGIFLSYVFLSSCFPC